MLTTKMLGTLFWEVYQNHLIPTIITQTTIAIITAIIEIIIAITITTITIITAIIMVIITIILPLIATTLRQIDYNADLSI